MGKGNLVSEVSDVQPRGFAMKEVNFGSKKLWTTLFPPSFGHRQGFRSRSEPLTHEKPSSNCEAPPKEDAFKGEHRWYEDSKKGLNFVGTCGMLVAENLEVSSFSPSQSSLSTFPTSCGLALPPLSPSIPVLPNSVIQSQYPMKNRVTSEIFSKKDDVGTLCQVSVGNPNLDVVESQFAHLNQMPEGFNPLKSMPNMPNEVSNLVLISGEAKFFSLGKFQIEGLSPKKMAKAENDSPQYLRPLGTGLKETKRVVCDRRFVGSVWTVRNKEWAALLACEALGGILIIWDSKKLCRKEVVIGSFSILVKFVLDGCGPLWLSTVYGPNSPFHTKDFWVELLDIFCLSFPLWCVGGDFNVIRRSSEKLGDSSLTSSMRDFDGFIRDYELLDPPLRNAPFTWSNMQESPVCKRLDQFLYSNEWEHFFPQSLQEVLPRWTLDHWPIVLDTNPFKWGPTPFRFENMWLQHPSFKECFSSWWRGFQGNGWECHKFMRKLQLFKQEGVLTSELSAQRALRKGELEELILREEIHWRQKAKVKWVKERDCNSKFFHKVANGRRNRKFIKFLENERGSLLRAGKKFVGGFQVGRNRTRVSHLQFADDTIFFPNTCEEDLQTLKSLLLVFGHISGLKVNLDKCLPLGGNPKACGFWDPVIERILQRLDGWQKAYLSFGGRITLIHSCLTHIPSYFLSYFKILASVAAKIEKLQRDFLWSGVGDGKRDHLVSWDIVYPRKSSALWHQVILSIYGTHPNGWDANTIVRWSHRCPWKAIAQNLVLGRLMVGGPTFGFPISKTI
ncbi:hypothetical protein AAG906_021271 [Vitis piasezkii]